MTPRSRSSFVPAAVRRWIPVGIAVALLAGVAAMVIARDLVSPATPAAPDRAAGSVDGLVRFRDAAGQISISHPAAWRRVASSDPEVRLLAEGEGSSMLVRMADLGVTVGPGRLEAGRRLTDKIVRSVGPSKLLRPPKQVTLGGLRGYLYLYTFPDDASGQLGAHAHYFLFRGQTLITIVFQTVPAERFVELAPYFDRIGETLRTTPG